MKTSKAKFIKGRWRKMGRPCPLRECARQCATSGDRPLADAALTWMRAKGMA